MKISELAIGHLLRAVRGLCAADVVVQLAPIKSRASPGHVERAVKLVENQYRAVLLDMQTRTLEDGGVITFRSVWVGRAEENDEHLVAN